MGDKSARRLKVVRIITRLNVGGPAQHVTLLTAGLPADEFETVLATGSLPPGEGDMTYYATEHGVRPVVIASMSRAVSPLRDLRALGELIALIWREKPDIVHTHTSKAGFLGRLAAALCGVPVIVHTFHGHVLETYFSRTKATLYRLLETASGWYTNMGVAVSDEVRADLLHLRLLPAHRLRTVSLGLDLQRFAQGPVGVLRAEIGVGPDVPLIGYCGRFVDVKNPLLLAAALEKVHAKVPNAHLVVIGDGDLRPALEAAIDARGLRDTTHFLGWRRDTDQLFRDLDVMVLCSNNEGTPVSLIEAGAAGVPAVSTRVGGVPHVVADGETGYLTPPLGGQLGEEHTADIEHATDADRDACSAGLAEALVRLVNDRDLARAMGAEAQRRYLSAFSVQRLVNDIAGLYRELWRRYGRK